MASKLIRISSRKFFWWLRIHETGDGFHHLLPSNVVLRTHRAATIALVAEIAVRERILVISATRGNTCIPLLLLPQVIISLHLVIVAVPHVVEHNGCVIARAAARLRRGECRLHLPALLRCHSAHLLQVGVSLADIPRPLRLAPLFEVAEVEHHLHLIRPVRRNVVISFGCRFCKGVRRVRRDVVHPLQRGLLLLRHPALSRKEAPFSCPTNRGSWNEWLRPRGAAGFPRLRQQRRLEGGILGMARPSAAYHGVARVDEATGQGERDLVVVLRRCSA
mmetsp:Transcript_28806/g.67012  ORF Transcript_28806/g.67012 Transcript_28806/m.67012 type:complete len:277 (+) Transcript_28806:3732-4562(+)